MTYLELVKIFHERNVDEHEVEKINCEAYQYLQHADPRAYQILYDKLVALAYTITKEQAEHIVKAMQPYGQVWTCEQVAEMVHSKGVNDRIVDWYLVMNMCYNDYFVTAKMYGLQNDTNFFYNLAKNFIEDPDGSPDKVAKYFLNK